MDGSTEEATREGDSHWSSSVTKMAGNAEVGHQYVGVERYVLRVKVRSRYVTSLPSVTVQSLSGHSLGPMRGLPIVVYRQY